MRHPDQLLCVRSALGDEISSIIDAEAAGLDNPFQNHN
jgi:hypothetical protein